MNERLTGHDDTIERLMNLSSSMRSCISREEITKQAECSKSHKRDVKASVAVPRNTLLKSASLIRNLQQHKAELEAELEAYKTASALLAEGIIDSDDLEEKIAELKSSPDKARSFMDLPIKRDFGELEKQSSSSEDSDPLTEYLLSIGD